MTADDRLLGALADELVPDGGDMPRASRAGVPGAGVDIVLRTRPDLVGPLDALLRAGEGRDPAAYLLDLRNADAEGFSVLSLVVVGGYLQDPEVQRLLGYTGRVAAPLDEPDATVEFEAALLAPVRAAGRRYRSTPE